MKKIMKQLDYDKDPDEFNDLISFLRTSWVQIPDKTSPSRFMRPLFVKRKATKSAKTSKEAIKNPKGTTRIMLLRQETRELRPKQAMTTAPC